MNERIRKIKEAIERRGGVISISEEIPEPVLELFLTEVLNCPECMANARREAHNGNLDGH
jgi:hypothetical protein